MDEDKVKETLERHNQLKSDRMVWEGHWRQVLRRVLPRQDDFHGSLTNGSRRTEYIFDSTAPLALDRFAAAMEGMLCPRAETWHGLTSTNTDLNKLPAVRLYFEEVTRTLFQYRYRPKANYASQFHETMMSLGSIGTGALFIDEIKTGGFGYKSIHMSEVHVAEDQHGQIDTVHREFDYTHRQAIQRWGEENLPPKLLEAAKKNPYEKSCFLHVIRPRQDVDPQRLDYRGMAIESLYLSVTWKHLISESGFHCMPIPVSRYVTAPRETYGRSPGMQALPDIKMINEMVKTTLRAAHKAVDPPLAVSDDGVLGRLQTKPGGINVGGLNRRGELMVRELNSAARIEWALKMIDRSQAMINDAFLVSLFQILVDGPDRMTATEVLERMREKGVLLAPAMGRQETELLGPQIEREIDILARQGRLPPMPGELIEAGGEYKVIYDNPLSRAQRAQQATGFTNWVAAVAPIAQVKPEVFDTIDAEKVGRGLAEVLGVPEGWLKTPDQVAEEKAEKAQAEQLQQLAAAIPQVGAGAKDLAQAGQIAAQGGAGE